MKLAKVKFLSRNDEVIDALKDAPRVRLYGSVESPFQPSGDRFEPGAALYGYAVAVEEGFDDKCENVAGHVAGTLIFIPAVPLDCFKRTDW